MMIRGFFSSYQFYFGIAAVVFFSGVFVRGEEYYFPWMLSWIVPLVVAIYLVISSRGKGATPEQHKKMEELSARRRQALQDRSDDPHGVGTYYPPEREQVPEPISYGKCIMCKKNMEIPGAYIESYGPYIGGGPFCSGCADRQRNDIQKSINAGMGPDGEYYIDY